MNLDFQEENSGGGGGSSSFQPEKRRRGRARRDYFQHVDASFASPGSETSFGTKSMVGQSVTGFVEATFDAGYVLNVRVGKSNVNLRGLVFKPGYYVPVTADNDIAPHLPMTPRNNICFFSEDLGFSQGQKLAREKAFSMPLKRKHASKNEAPIEGSAVAPGVLNGTPIFYPEEAGQLVMELADFKAHDSLKVTLRTGQDEGIQTKGQTAGSGDAHILSSMEVAHIYKEMIDTVTPEPAVLQTMASSESEKHGSSFIPSLSCVDGRMSELLQALEENMKESHHVQTEKQPPSLPKLE